ncbi:hypothetical protein IH779_01995 [Patescibacteria group bacterium]|nr:hypothetical protein [Patescibacteria group bacterium]
MPFEDLLQVLKPEQLAFIWDIVKNWIWVPLAILFFYLTVTLYLFLIRERWLSRTKWITLEIKIPKEILKPIKAMENVFSNLWAIYDPANPRERWLEGKVPLSISCEIVSIDGEPHFYIRVPIKFQPLVESAIYSQYADVEISVVDDYTKYVPLDIPNKDWEMWGTDYILNKPDSYPIKTHPFFELEREIKEEKRVDPMSFLLEGLSKLGPGEQLWVQITAVPVTNLENNWVSRGEKIRDKLAKRILQDAPKPLIQEAAEVLISGPPVPSAEKEIFPPEMRLTPGERDVIVGVENKIGKHGFETNIRFIYLAKRDVYFPPNFRSVMGFFASFATQNLNALRPWTNTITKIHTLLFWFLDKRRLYIRKRRMFRNYIRRFSPLFPRRGGTYVLNIEELATLFHFPSKIVAPAPTLPRVEVKKREAPPGLPTE